jgi:serine/threonine-protein kinase HipA
MLKLNFSVADLNIREVRERTQRASVSGVQDKVQLKRIRGGYEVVEKGGDFILKPVPRNTFAELAEDIPINEALTMDIAQRVFKVKTAEHQLAVMNDGQYAYLTRRFDIRNGKKIRQEDFCQISGRTSESHGENYKYNSSYEELALLVKRFCSASKVENPKIFFLIVFNYVLGNGDAHLKNFSLYEGEQGDYVLAPAYDLLNTSVHFPNEATVSGLDFFADGHFTSSYEALGFYSSADFIELGGFFGVDEDEVLLIIANFKRCAEKVRKMVEDSLLSQEAKCRYLQKFYDRLKAIGT